MTLNISLISDNYFESFLVPQQRLNFRLHKHNFFEEGTNRYEVIGLSLAFSLSTLNYFYFTLVMYYNTMVLEPSYNCDPNRLIQIEKDLFFPVIRTKMKPLA